MSKSAKRSKSRNVVIVEPCIRELRGQRVILDADLARIYGVTTKRFNEQVRRNRKRFPTDFIFQLTRAEVDAMGLSRDVADGKDAQHLRSQNATSSSRHGGRRYLPYVFTEHGAVMAATILSSPQAVQMSILVVRAFVRMKNMLSSEDGLARELKALKKELRGRLDIHEAAINDILKRIMLIIDPPLPPSAPEPPRRKIGFHV